MNKDQKGDLVEQLIFEVYKDKFIRSSKAFKDEILKSYGYVASTELYKRIMNYQIKRYGRTLQDIETREYVKWFGLKSKRLREKGKRVADRKYETRKFLERIEKNEIKRAKEITN